MRVFVTGGNGFIGTAVVNDLIANGHTVLALARSDESAAKLESLGAEVLRGSLETTDLLVQAAKDCDGVAHLAFDHDRGTFSNMEANSKKDHDVIKAMGEAMVGTNKPLLITTGTLLLPGGKIGTEDDGPDMDDAFARMRGEQELTTIAFAKRGVRGIVIRLAPLNHGKGDAGFTPIFLQTAKKSGESIYVGDGQQRWSAAHHLDSARVYRLALEKGKAGAVYHPLGEEQVRIKDIAAAIGKKVGVPVVSKTPEEAASMSFVGAFLDRDRPASSEKTRKELGWQPTKYGLVECIQAEYDVPADA